MEKIKHLLKIIWNQRRQNVWIMGELLIVSVCLWYVVDYISNMTTVVMQPLGFDINHTYRMDIFEKSPGSNNYINADIKHTSLGEDFITIAERIRQYPDVEAVSISISSQPYAATNYRENLHYDRLYMDDTHGILAQRYWVTPSFFDVFSISSQNGSINELMNSLHPNTIIVTPDVEKEFSSTLLGKDIKIGEEGSYRKVEAISVPIRWTEYRKSFPSYYQILTETELLSMINSDNLQQVELCVRVKPEADQNFPDKFVADFSNHLFVGNLYLMDVYPTSLIRKAVVQPAQSEIRVRVIILLFLVVNIFIGISGTFWLRTKVRRNEMGLRIAIGSTRNGIRFLLILEGVVMLILAMLPAIIINFNIGMTELVNTYWSDFTISRFFSGILFTFLIMSFIIISGIWYPAHFTLKMSSAEALRHE